MTSALAAGHTGAMMNEKIESLANIWANRRREEEGLGIVYVFTEKALQVFADKIVKECIDSVKEDMHSGHSHSDFSTGYDAALEMAICNIKEKFGVEE